VVSERDRDDYYPCGSVWFKTDGVGMVVGSELLDTVFEFPVKKERSPLRVVVRLNAPKENKNSVFMFTGEPRLGKTTVCKTFFNQPWLDTDSFGYPMEVADRLEGVRAFVVGKYRNQVIETNQGKMKYPDVLKKMLLDQLNDVYELHFQEKVDGGNEDFVIFITGHERELQQIKPFLKQVSLQPIPGHMVFSDKYADYSGNKILIQLRRFGF
jgi:hypothetical protein